jgi:hypothetical protein
MAVRDQGLTPSGLLPAKLRREPPVRLDALMSKEQFRALVRHMLNENPDSHFLVVHRDESDKNAPARFHKASPRRNVNAHADWAYDTVTGKAKVKTGLGLYPKNEEGKSTWAAIDFDAHNGDSDEVAEARAIRALTLLLEYRDRSVILSASGRGYHVFIFAKDLRPIGEWTHLLKDVVETIPVTVQDGQCELFLGEHTGTQPCGKAIRAPGTYNPTTDSVELIMADNIDPLLDSLTAEAQKPPLLSLTTKSFLAPQVVRDREANSSSSSTGGSNEEEKGGKRDEKKKSAISLFASVTTEGLIKGAIDKYPIVAKGTRHGVLLKLAGALFHKFGRELSEKIVRRHYELNEKNIATPLKAHIREFAAAWTSFWTKARKSFSDEERRIFEKLKTHPQQEGFLIVRSFARMGRGDFMLGQSSFADRLSITQGAARVIEKLVELGAIGKTANARINSRPAFYRWTANETAVTRDTGKK